MPVIEAVNKTGAVNHFEKTHPKDDFELLHVSHVLFTPQLTRDRINVYLSNKHSVRSPDLNDVYSLQIKQESIAVAKQEKVEGKGNSNKAKGKETAAAEQQPRSAKVSKEKKPPTPAAEETAAIGVVQEAVASQPANVVISNNNGPPVTSVKDKKKKKSEFNTLQQMSECYIVNNVCVVF